MPVFPVVTPTKSAQDLINETLQYLNSSYHEQINQLAADIDDATDTFALAYSLSGIKGGVSISIGLEDMHVWATTESSLTVKVKRGMRGSTPTAHTTDELVIVKPLYSYWSVLRAMNNDIADLSANGLFRVQTTSLTWNPSIQGYDLPDVLNILDILEVRFADTNTVSQRWPIIPSGNYSIGRNMDSPFTSGLALFFTSGAPSNSEVLITYSSTFSPLAALDDDVSDATGLVPSMHRLPPVGAAISLAGPQEIKRNMTENQGDTRRAGEVPPGARAASIRPLQILRQQWLVNEATQLRKEYPFHTATLRLGPRRRWT